MLNLFDQRQLLSLERTESVQLACLGRLCSASQRCVLYTDQDRLFVCQLDGDRFDRVSIPVDSRKGPIVSMCLNKSSTELLALTSQSLLYLVPLNFDRLEDRRNRLERVLPKEEATVIDCRHWLSEASALCWWQRDRSMVVKHSSVAIMGNLRGEICFVDLTNIGSHQPVLIKTVRVAGSIVSLQIFDEMYCTSLLVTCQDNTQYHLVLEQFRTVLNVKGQDSPSSLDSPGRPCVADSSKLSGSTCSSSASNWTYLSCISIDLQMNRAYDTNNRSKVRNDNGASQEDCSRQPQLVRFVSDSITTASQPVHSSEPDILSNLDSILNADLPVESQSPVVSSHCSSLCIHPQPVQRSVLVVKQNQPNLTAQTDSDLDTASCSDSSFSNVLLYRELTVDIYEFPCQDFCTSSILLSSSRLYLVTVNNQLPQSDDPNHLELDEPSPSQTLHKVLDCGPRFLLLLYRPNRCLLISKKFSEQRNSSANSPRSPLLLNRKNSSSRSGSFRRKQQSQSSARAVAVIEDFFLDDHDDLDSGNSQSGSVVDVFCLDPTSSSPPCAQSVFSQDELAQLSNCTLLSPDCTATSGLDNLDRMLHNELGAIELLCSDKMASSVLVQEQLLVVTRHGLHLVHPKQTQFAQLFHCKIVEMLDSLYADPINDGGFLVEGDLITSAKFMVDCLVSRRSRTSTQDYSTLQPYHSWQNWLQRSALLLLRQSAAVTPEQESSPDPIGPSPSQHRILLLFELSRTPKRRLITALNHFGLHSLALFYCRKFFETKILQELSDEERLYLSHQMFHSLLSLYLQAQSGPDRDLAVSTASRQLYSFFVEYRIYYQCRHLIDSLLDHRLTKMACFVAQATGNCVTLIHLVLSKFFADPSAAPLSSEERVPILDLLTSPRMCCWLIESTDYLDGVRHSISLIESYLNHFVLRQLPSLSSRYLHRLARVFDPSSLWMHLLMDSVLDNTNQTYLRPNLSADTLTSQLGQCDPATRSDQPIRSSSILPICKKDLLNLHLFLLLLSLRKCNAKLARHCLGPVTKLTSSKLDKHSSYDWEFVQNAHCLIKSAPLTPVLSSVSQSKSSNSAPHEYRVCAGTYHSCAFRSGMDQLFVWGKFTHYNFIQASLSRSCSHSGPSSARLRWSRPSRHLKSPTLVDYFSNVISETVQIKSVATGHQHLLVLTNLGLFALGSSTFGQLGLGSHTLETRYPMLVEWFAEAGVSLDKVCCGSYHSFGLTSSGQLYAWGWALHGQLGIGSIDDEFEPRLVDYFTKNELRVAEVAAGYAHSVVLTEQGTVFVFGENSYGQLGLGDSLPDPNTKYSLPQQVTSLDAVCLIACGLFHSVVVTDATASNNDNLDDSDDCGTDYHKVQMDKLKQRVLCWGLDPKSLRVHMRSDRANQMYKMSDSKPTLADCKAKSIQDYGRPRQISLDKLNENEAGSIATLVSIRKVAAGQSHTLLLTDNGHVYCFGSGREGQLGLGKTFLSVGDQLKPITDLDNIADISCGALHSLAVSNDGAIWAFGQNSDYQLSSNEDGENQVLETGDSARGSSGRRSSFLGTLVKRDEQLTRLMSMQKNVESIPIFILINWTQTVNLSHNRTSWPHVTRPQCSTSNYRSPRMIRQVLLETLVRYRDDLDYRALLKRSDHFGLPQLSSLISLGLSDFCLSFRYQLEALRNEIGIRFGMAAHCLEVFAPAWVEQLSQLYLKQTCQLVMFFVAQCSQQDSSSDRHICNSIYQLLQNLYAFLTQIEVLRQEGTPTCVQRQLLNDLTLCKVVQTVFLQSEEDNGQTPSVPIQNPYFGLNLLRLVDQQQQQRKKSSDGILASVCQITLDDHTLLQVVQRTEQLIRPGLRSTTAQPQSNLTDIQQLIEQLVDLECYRHHCGCSNWDPTQWPSSTFPLEMAWQKIVHQFRPVSSSHRQAQQQQQQSQPCLPIELPSDLDPTESDSCLLTVFACGHHYLGSQRLIQHLESILQLDTTQDTQQHSPLNNRTEYSRLAQLLSHQSGSASDLAELVAQLSCPKCVSPHLLLA